MDNKEDNKDVAGLTTRDRAWLAVAIVISIVGYIGYSLWPQLERILRAIIG